MNIVYSSVLQDLAEYVRLVLIPERMNGHGAIASVLLDFMQVHGLIIYRQFAIEANEFL